MVLGPHIKRACVKIAFHNPELIFDLYQPVIFLNAILGTHDQLGRDDLVISQAFPVLGHLLLNKHDNSFVKRDNGVV